VWVSSNYSGQGIVAASRPRSGARDKALEAALWDVGTAQKGAERQRIEDLRVIAEGAAESLEGTLGLVMGEQLNAFSERILLVEQAMLDLMFTLSGGYVDAATNLEGDAVITIAGISYDSEGNPIS
jgi:hypothetical protein